MSWVKWLAGLSFFFGQILPFTLASVLFVILILHIFDVYKVQINDLDVVHNLSLLLAGSIGWFFLYRRTRSAEQTTEIAGKGLDADRFKHSVEQLVSKDLSMRLVGLHSFEQIAIDTHKKERLKIIGILSIRIHELASPDRGSNLKKWQRLEIESAIEILAKITESLSEDEKRRFCKLENIDLSSLVFEKIDLSCFKLIRVDLTASEFRKVDFTDTALSFSTINDTNFINCKGLAESRVMTAKWSKKHPPQGLEKWNLPSENHPREDGFISQPIRTK